MDGRPAVTTVALTRLAVQAGTGAAHRPARRTDRHSARTGTARGPGRGGRAVQASVAVTIGARARKARPRWLIESFSSAVISAVVLVSPSGTKIGS